MKQTFLVQSESGVFNQRCNTMEEAKELAISLASNSIGTKYHIFCAIGHYTGQVNVKSYFYDNKSIQRKTKKGKK